MVARKDAPSQEIPEPETYESPWKLLLVFAVLLAAALAYGFIN